MAEVPLSGKNGDGKILLIDDDVWDKIKGLGLRLQVTNKGYVNISIALHRFVMQPPNDMVVDHINRNPLDNRKENLRITTHAQNAKNKGKRTTGTTSKWLGVSKGRGDYYYVRVGNNYKTGYCGTYKSELAAAYAYNKQAQATDEHYSLNDLSEYSIEYLESLLITDRLYINQTYKSKTNTGERYITYDKKAPKTSCYKVVFWNKDKKKSVNLKCFATLADAIEYRDFVINNPKLIGFNTQPLNDKQLNNTRAQLVNSFSQLKLAI